MMTMNPATELLNSRRFSETSSLYNPTDDTFKHVLIPQF